MASPNRQYESMLTVARERLSRHAPEAIARRAGVTWDGGRHAPVGEDDGLRPVPRRHGAGRRI